MTVAARSPLTSAYVELLRAQLPIPVGDGAAPTADSLPGGQRLPPGGFIIVYELDATPLSRGWTGTGSAMIEVVHQITTTGIQRDQASMACDMAADVLEGKNPAGGFVYPVSVTGHTIMDRWIRAFMPMLSEGTFQSGFHLVTALAIV